MSLCVDQVPGPSQIRDSNTHMLVALLGQLGCEVADVARVPDDRESIRDAIRRGMQHDALFITGGMSMGEYDYVPGLLVELGVDMKITKLRIKPGKPFVFGVGPPAHPSFVFGLPGNPVSASSARFVLPRACSPAWPAIHPRSVGSALRLPSDLPPNGPREFYQPALLSIPSGRFSAERLVNEVAPLSWKGSADIFTLASANALIVRAENEPELKQGTIVRVLAL